MAGSKALTPDERLIFNLKVPDRTPTSRPAIDVKPDVILRAKEGMRMQVECRLEHDQTRPSKHKDCDVVEFRHWFNTAPTSVGTDPTNPAPLATATVVKIIGESGRAKFIIQFAETDAGKILNLEARWKNSKENHKSGPWCEVVSARVIW